MLPLKKILRFFFLSKTLTGFFFFFHFQFFSSKSNFRGKNHSFNTTRPMRTLCFITWLYFFQSRGWISFQKFQKVWTKCSLNNNYFLHRGTLPTSYLHHLKIKIINLDNNPFLQKVKYFIRSFTSLCRKVDNPGKTNTLYHNRNLSSIESINMSSRQT